MHSVGMLGDALPTGHESSRGQCGGSVLSGSLAVKLRYLQMAPHSRILVPLHMVSITCIHYNIGPFLITDKEHAF